ncbi:MAG: response regulator [Alphaproteobacteria bacterium]|nr:response regulator [Alphaproteobacteria bacterium]
MVNINPLRKYRLLLVDHDAELAKVLRSMLAEMGFTACDTTGSGAEAMRMLQNQPYDFLITEWNTQQLNGIDLVKKIRRAPNSPNPVLPIIMLTGRAEQSDVLLARDRGINEFVVKPFSAKTIYNRIERIVEHPRQFIVSPSFVGPNRRARGAPPPGMANRRTMKIQPQLQPLDMLGAIEAPQQPRIWLPDFSLKYKLGGARLDSLITPAVLEQAQAAVDAISDASLGWIKTNLEDLRALSARMQAGDYPPMVAHDLGELALTLNARAGTFGYGRASEIAYLLYLFCRNHLNPRHKDHHVIVQKHIDVLHVILGNKMRGSAGELGDQLAGELKKLADKFSQS